MNHLFILLIINNLANCNRVNTWTRTTMMDSVGGYEPRSVVRERGIQGRRENERE